MDQVTIQMVETVNNKAKKLNADRQRLIGQQEANRQAYEKSVAVYKQKYGIDLDDTNLQSELDTVTNNTNMDYERLNNLVISIENGEYLQNASAAVIPDGTTTTPTTVPTEVTPTVQAQPSFATQQTQTGFGVQQQQAVQQQAQTQFQQPTQPQSQFQSQFQQTAQTQQQVQQQQPNMGAFGAFGQPVQQQQAQPTTQPPAQQGFSETFQPTQNQEPVQQHRTVDPALAAQANMQAESQKPASNPFAVEQSDTQQQDVSEQPFQPQGWGTPTKDINAQFGNIMGNGVKFGQQ